MDLEPKAVLNLYDEENGSIEASSDELPKIGFVGSDEVFYFDQVYSTIASQDDFCNDVAVRFMPSFMNGIPCFLFTYGEAATGSTYAIFGNDTTDGVTQIFLRLLYEFKPEDSIVLLQMHSYGASGVKVLIDESKTDDTSAKSPTQCDDLESALNFIKTGIKL